jgi:hypothetical protein
MITVYVDKLWKDGRVAVRFHYPSQGRTDRRVITQEKLDRLRADKETYSVVAGGSGGVR